ncbi:MAG: hypothetical protein BGO67_06380 [Alphaproteobacteria bacterium 41-28]|nr:MAG: hypothetical protein BGO67_06380 [Alphaproteobacteria bacterium 41-28]
MSLKSMFTSLLLSTALLSSATFAMEENGSQEERPGSTKASPLKLRDFYHSKAELLSILKDNEGNPFKYHKDYENFANEMLSYAEKSIENSGGKLQENLSDLNIIKEQLRTYCDKNTLNLPRLTWLSLQIGMVLTPRELRNRPGQAETISKQMNGFDPGIKDEALQPICYLRPPKRRNF